MIGDVVAYTDLKFRCIGGEGEIPHHIKADEIWFDESNGDWSKKHSRVFEWSSNVAPRAVGPSLKISVVEAPVRGCIDHINITLRDCELDQFPSLRIEEVEE